MATSVVSNDPYILKVFGVVLVIGNAFADTIFIDGLHLSVHVSIIIPTEHFAKLDARAVLHANRVNVSQIEKEVALNEVCCWNIENVREDVSATSCELLFNPQVLRPHNLRALYSRFAGGCENLFIKCFEVFDCVDYPRAGPGANGVVGVLAFEPSGQRTRVTTSDGYPVRFAADGCLESCIHFIDEIS